MGDDQVGAVVLRVELDAQGLQLVGAAVAVAGAALRTLLGKANLDSALNVSHDAPRNTTYPQHGRGIG
ncbi:hypothetical protein D3C78_1688400 [compost metagenome]